MNHWRKVLFLPERTATRAATLVAALSLWFLASGIMGAIPGSSYLAEPPIDFDVVLRSLATGLYKPERVIPIAIVDIDEKTHRVWNSPATTPREALARMLGIVTASSPAAVVVDIDLSGGHDSVSSEDRALLEYLRRYEHAAPLVFPKRLEPGVNGIRAMIESPFDEVFASNPKLSWAHVNFISDGEGSMRHWSDWVQVCSAARPRGQQDVRPLAPTDSQSSWLPAVATRVMQMLPTLPRGLDRPTEPAEGTCAVPIEITERRLLIGPRLTGESRSVMSLDANVVSASLLLDPNAARDDAGLFGGRVVLIGATHTGAGDFWLTPSGLLPGVELLANTVRYAPLRATTHTVGYRVIVLMFFVGFVVAAWYFKALVAFVVATGAASLLASIAVSVWDHVSVFDALESAVFLTVVYLIIEAVLELADGIRKTKGVPVRKRFSSVFMRER